MQQDITPQRRIHKRPLQVPARDISLAPAPRPIVGMHTSFTRQTQTISDILPSGEVIITETRTETYETETESPLQIKEIESLSPRDKNQALQRALMLANRELKKERRKQKDMKRFGLVLLASVLVLVTGYVSIDTILTNQQVKAETSKRTYENTAGAPVTREDEGTEEAVPTAGAVAAYSVAPDQPQRLFINKLNVSSRILPMGVNADNSIQAPRNIFDAGWYTGSVKPGQVGAMFIDAHASGPTREGLFAYLDTLVKGDEIQIEKGDGSRLTYRVVHTEVAPLEGLDMKKMLLPYGNTVRGLNLMTCTGSWVDSQKTYDQRVLVWTEQVS